MPRNSLRILSEGVPLNLILLHIIMWETNGRCPIRKAKITGRKNRQKLHKTRNSNQQRHNITKQERSDEVIQKEAKVIHREHKQYSDINMAWYVVGLTIHHTAEETGLKSPMTGEDQEVIKICVTTTITQSNPYLPTLSPNNLLVLF